MALCGSRILVLCLVGSGFASFPEDHRSAWTIEKAAPEVDHALSLLQTSARSRSTSQTLASKRKELIPAWMPAKEIWMVEFLAMLLFVFVGCGSAMSVAKQVGSAWILQVSLTFGIAITVLAYAFGHYTGAHINSAVTFAMMLIGEVTVPQGIAYIVAQLLGSIGGALLLWVVYSGIPRLLKVYALNTRAHQGEQHEYDSDSLDSTGGLGTNKVAEGVPLASALVFEIVGTFLLVYVVLETTVNTKQNNVVGLMAPLAIGFTVFLAHSVLISIDGCSINPARSTGPAIVNAIANPKASGTAVQHLWVFWVGPLVGAAIAAGVFNLMSK